MHSELRERIDDLLARAGLGGVKGSAVKAAVAVAVVAAGFAVARSGGAQGAEFASSGPVVSVEQDVAKTGEAESASVVVHVAGAVNVPGVYELAMGARVDDALRAAGGARDAAAIDALNLARILVDGEQVYVATVDELAAGASGGGASAAGGASQATGTAVNVNTATAADLDALPGIGPSTAQKIVDDRTANGPFATIEDLMRVSGIGAAKVESLRDLVSVK